MLTENQFISQPDNPAAPVSAWGNPELKLLTSESTGRTQLEKFISKKFYATHSAEIDEFMPYLLELKQANQRRAGLGLRPGVDGNFFLQTYLDKPVEQIIAGLSRAPCSRDKIVEIGNFAATGAVVGSILFSVLAKSLLQAGFEWMVFTATPKVAKMITHLDCEPTIIGVANPDKLGDSALCWGDYYKNNPTVMACQLRQAIGFAGSNHRTERIFEEYASDIEQLASTLEWVVRRGL